MPRLKRNPEQDRDARIRAVVACQQKLYGLTSKETYEQAGIKQWLYHDRLRHPGQFKLSEIRALDSVLHFTEEQKRVFV